MTAKSRTRTRSPKGTNVEPTTNSQVDRGHLPRGESMISETLPAPVDPPGDFTSESDSSAQELDNINGLGRLGTDVKKLVQGIQQLRHLGVEDFNTPLPKITVIGDQSTGKSSLIEGISGIKVPREAGCCTRCPVEINLTGSSRQEERWTCRVFLCKKYIFDGTQTNVGATRNRPLGTWIQQDTEVQHFATTYDRTCVQEIIYWAQLAVLNPSSACNEYKPGHNSATPNTMQVKFSPNVVRLDIFGPDLPDLSFYDLPGVINVTELEHEKYLVKLVKNLVKDYIKADDCINLLALPMSNDPANSTAASIIMEMKAQGRTIGVLTKPDRFQQGESLEQWTSILDGHKLRLGLGYYVVKNNPDPMIDHATARIEEMEFFRTVEPYAGKLEGYKAQFGTFRLQTALSYNLTNQILLSLPRIKSQIEEKSATVSAELNTLPKTLTGNLPIIIDRCISAFSQSLQLHIDGGSPEYPFRKDWVNIMKGLQKELAESRPVLSMPPVSVARQVSEDGFLLETPSTPTPIRKAGGSITIEDSDDAKLTKTTPSRKRANNPPTNSTPRKRCKMIDVPLSQPSIGNAKHFSLAEVQQIIQAGYISLPGSIDPRVIERMSRTSMFHWEDLAMSFLEKTRRLCETVVVGRIDEHFKDWRTSRLYDEVMNFSGTFLNEAIEQQQLALSRNLALELQNPMTFNVKAIEHAYNEAFEYLRSVRRLNRATSLLNEEEAISGKSTVGHARQEKINKITEERLGPDPFSLEIRVMGRVIGYYEWAYSRFVDMVGLSFQGELFVNIRDNLPRILTQQLGIELDDANERCALLLAVDPYVEQRRIQLKKEQATLLKAQDHLLKLMNDTHQGEGSDGTFV